MTRYHVGSTSMKVARPNGNGSRHVQPTVVTGFRGRLVCLRAEVSLRVT